MSNGRLDPGALLWIFITVLIWGGSWVTMKALVPFIGPFDLVVGRYLVGFLCLLLMVLVLKKPLRFPPFWLSMGIAVFQTAGYQCLVQMALVTGGTGRVVMVAYTLPFWVVVFAWLLLGDRPTRWHWIAFGLAGAGLLSVMRPWEGLGGMGSSMLALAGGVAWGLGTVLSKVLFQRHRVEPLSLTMWQLLLGALLTLPFAWLVPQPPIVWGHEVFLGLAYLGVLGSALGWALWMIVVRRVSPTVVGMSGLGVPVVAIILAWWLLGERPLAIEQLGMVLMLAGLVMVNLAPGPRATRPSAGSRPAAS